MPGKLYAKVSLPPWFTAWSRRYILNSPVSPRPDFVRFMAVVLSKVEIETK